MHKAFDAFFKFDKNSVISDTDHFTLNFCFNWEFGIHIHPWIGAGLLEPQRDTFFVFIVFQNHYRYLVTDRKHFGGMVNSAPRHISDVEQPVDSTQVDEHAIFSNIFNNPFNKVAFIHSLKSTRANLFALFFQKDSARENNVPAFFVHLDNFHIKFFANQFLKIANGAKVDLRSWQKSF